MDEYGRIHFPNTTSNDIWMSTNELIDLFGITYSTLRANIKAIYKSGILDECEVQRCIKLSNGINMDVYALSMIIALSFRLNTLGAYKVRESAMKRLTANPKNSILFLNVRTHECMNESKYGLNWEFHSYALFCQFPSYVHSSMGTKLCANRLWNLQVQAANCFLNNLPLILREYCSEKTCIFQVRTDKVPIEEMTDRWEIEYSDGWQSIDSFTIRFFFRRKNPSLKETRSSNSVFATDQLDCRSALYGRHACELYSLITHKLDKPPYYLPMLCNSTIHKPRIKTLDLCFSEHSKVCFQPLEINGAASNLMFAGTWQGMFWVTQNFSGYSRKPCRIPRTSPSEVGRISKLDIFLGYYSFILDKINTFALNSIDWL